MVINFKKRSKIYNKIAISTEVMNIELKTCPFCGGKAEVTIAKSPMGTWFVFCKNCKSSTDAFKDDEYFGEKEVWINGEPYYQKSKTARQKAIIAWNRRASIPDK